MLFSGCGYFRVSVSTFGLVWVLLGGCEYFWEGVGTFGWMWQCELEKNKTIETA